MIIPPWSTPMSQGTSPPHRFHPLRLKCDLHPPNQYFLRSPVRHDVGSSTGRARSTTESGLVVIENKLEIAIEIPVESHSPVTSFLRVGNRARKPRPTCSCVLVERGRIKSQIAITPYQLECAPAACLQIKRVARRDTPITRVFSRDDKRAHHLPGIIAHVMFECAVLQFLVCLHILGQEPDGPPVVKALGRHTVLEPIWRHSFAAAKERVLSGCFIRGQIGGRARNLFVTNRPRTTKAE